MNEKYKCPLCGHVMTAKQMNRAGCYKCPRCSSTRLKDYVPVEEKKDG